MASKKMTISSGLNSMAIGTSIATGIIAGVELEVQQNDKNTLNDPEIVWDDSEEQRYRMWLHEMQVARSSKSDVEWTELAGEQAYRDRLRDEASSRENQDINWEDTGEREYRKKYLELRKQQLVQANWQELEAEEQHRQQIRRQQDSRSRKPVKWDDEEERRCQEKYRQKYN